MSLPSLSVIGPYRLGEKLGEGGMGSVYEAVHKTLGQHVAIKILAPQYTQNREIVTRFFNEARAAARIEHPGIVQIFDSGELLDGTAFLVMELIKGESLCARLQRERLPLLKVLQLAWQVASALAAAHEAGIVHRDLKPENLMLVPDPLVPGEDRIKVLDFGIAKLSQAGIDSTRSNVIMGTPRYMAPEQCRGAARVDDRADVYSLGVNLFELISGVPLFEADSANAYLFLHVTELPPHLASVAPNVPREVADLVHRLLIKAPAMRPSMRQVAAELKVLIERVQALFVPTLIAAVEPADRTLPQASATPTQWQSSTPLEPVRKRSRRRLLIGGVGAALAAGTLLLLERLRYEPGSGPIRLTQRNVAEGTSSPLPPTEAPSSPAQPDAGAEPSTDEAVEEDPPAAHVDLAITTEPAGASVLDEKGQLLGTTPWQKTQPAASGYVTMRLRLPGYKDHSVRIAQSASTNHQIKMRPIELKQDTPPATGRHENTGHRKPSPETPNPAGITHEALFGD